MHVTLQNYVWNSHILSYMSRNLFLTLWNRQIRYFADDILNQIVLSENVRISLQTPPTFILKDPSKSFG